MNQCVYETIFCSRPLVFETDSSYDGLMRIFSNEFITTDYVLHLCQAHIVSKIVTGIFGGRVKIAIVMADMDWPYLQYAEVYLMNFLEYNSLIDLIAEGGNSTSYWLKEGF